ncbi:hypothetical protein [Geothrix edaphica]|uniref:hypothetical protein n=1 Tax=Geothrix edaphica TaxID=2927976 RepID=UPI0025540AAC|nr:hypothetical protein [Geothrix edaphica]
MRDIFGDQDEEKLLGEARAWQILVEAQAGVCAFHAMTGDDPGKARGLRGARTASTKALDRAVHGYRVAFPDVMAEAGIRSALEGAASTCVRGFMEDLEGDGPAEDREVLQESIYRDILGALTKATE